MEAGTEGIKREEDAEVPPDSSKTSIDNCDVDIDTIDNFVIISFPRKISAAAAVSMKGYDEAMASDQPVKRTPKKKGSKKRKDFRPHQLSPQPPYFPSEYELKRPANIKRIEVHMESMFPTDGAGVSKTIICNCLIYHCRAKRKEKARKKRI